MDFQYSDKVHELLLQLNNFMDEHIIPRNGQFLQEFHSGGYQISFLNELKELAKSEGLWNLFLPHLKEGEDPGTLLTNLEYAPLAERMGRLTWASEVFNCSAPDTGNMELLHMFGTKEQREQWLKPLMNGDIRSCFAMTEPDVASSDATNVATMIRRDGNDYVINGRKWFITGALNPHTKVSIVMGKTDPEADIHKQQSMILVPLDTLGVKLIRDLSVMNHHSYETHGEIVFEDVRVPASNLLGDEGSGFALAQARLGPGRIHHCMRCIGQAQLALDLMVERSLERKTFGKYLSDQGTIQTMMAESRCDIEQARLLVLKAAYLMDHGGVKQARNEIAMIKVVIPRMQQGVLDRAMQVFGAMGLSTDTPFPELWTMARSLRIADGPDEVHLRSIAKGMLKQAKQDYGQAARFLTPPNRDLEVDSRGT